MAGALVALSASSLSLTSTSTAMVRPAVGRSGCVSMGFGPSEKELSNDPPIAEVLAKCKVEQRERLAMQALAASNSAYVPGGLELARSLPGVGPFGYFDPWNLTPDSQRDVVLWREAELMHCRVSMLAVVGFVFGERAWTPFMPSMEVSLAINQFTQLTPELVITFVGLVALVENYRTNRGWMELDFSNSAAEANTVRTLRSTYTPGDLGFDPLSLLPKEPAQRTAMIEKELNNGRLSMIGVAGFVGQELATGQPIFA